MVKRVWGCFFPPPCEGKTKRKVEEKLNHFLLWRASSKLVELAL
jgi:hypothetical protein